MTCFSEDPDMRVLLTAFEPFGGEQINAALEAVKRMKAPQGAELTILTVPTVFGLCTETVISAVRSVDPDYVICVGQASGRNAITPERVAINVRDARIPDNAGNQPVDQRIDPDGPAAYFSTLPIRSMVEAMQTRDISAAISNSAGTFVCNDLFYGLCRALDTEFSGIKGGFIHVPCTPDQAAGSEHPLPSMEIQAIALGLEISIEALFKA